jgi:hypothetical protein
MAKFLNMVIALTLTVLIGSAVGAQHLYALDCTDYDEDGYGDGPDCLGPDCNDYDAAINPAADEVYGNCIDDDCNPLTSDESIVVGDWYIECLDMSYYTNANISISIDPADHVHMSYNDYLNSNSVQYTTDSSGSWITDSVDTISFYASMATDASGVAHIIYYKPGTGLNHAKSDSGSWIIETIDSIGRYPDAAIDPQGNLHVIYVNNIYDFTYATNKSGGWVSETLDTNVALATIATDSSANVHISYYYGATKNLKYVTNKSGSWSYQVIDNVTNTGMGSIIAVDSNDNIHIAYLYQDPDLIANIMYATNESGSWVKENLYSILGATGSHLHMSLDSFNNVHISYKDKSANLKYITNVSGSWESQTIDIFKATKDTAIALNSSDDVYISYFGLGGGLKYAYFSCPYLPVRISGGSPVYYDWFQSAYDNASSGQTLQLRNYRFDETLILNDNKAIIIEIGHNCYYSSNAGSTIINGSMTITDGALTISSGTLVVQ